MKNLKTRLLSLVVIFSVLMIGSAKADNVNVQTAKEVGAYYFTVATGAKAPVSADDLKLAHQLDNPTLCIPAVYIFNVKDNGFVIVSASECVEPVLAYSPDGFIDPENINPECQYMLDSYAKVVSDFQNNNNTPDPEYQQRWNELTQRTFTCNPDSKAVLIKAKWDQGYPYNIMCPKVNGQLCYSGCVATAMSMIIHYWKHPVNGGSNTSMVAACSWNGQTIRYRFAQDSNKFVYDSMPNQIFSNSAWNYKRAIGKLQFACGVTVKMGWGVDGSGAHSQDVPAALYNWFRYSTDATYLSRNSYTDANWVALLHNEIDDNARPVYYSASDPDPNDGRDAAGHAFVIGGTSGSDQNKFYICWGWGGSSDGFYTLAPARSIASAGGYKFSKDHAMVYNIYPDKSSIDENTAFSVSPAYPNPATDYMMVPADLSVNAYLSIYSLDGKLIENLVIPARTKEYRLDLQNYAPGTYIYRLNGSAVKFTVQ